MRRRDFIAVAGCAAATWSFAARAQQRERGSRVAVLEPVAKDTPSAQARYTAFLQAFEQLGWTDGRNVQIVARWSGGSNVELRKYADELVALAPDVILAGGGTSAEALLKVTRTIPIVFAIVPDPVGAGIVERLSRPGGNATGFMMFEYNLCGKWLELFREIAPSVTMRQFFAIPDLLTGSASSPSFKPWPRRLALKSAQLICASQIRLNAPSGASHNRQMVD
jgi:putative tryptophan/tyrosine transport system substrate-binding protein